MSRQISITQALNELKLLEKRINDKIGCAVFLTSKVNNETKVLNGKKTPEEFEKEVKADYASILDLINNRKVIKSKIVESNATTFVEINGKKYTVADAIERKSSIIYEQKLLQTLMQQRIRVTADLERYNQSVVSKAELLKEQTLSADKNDKDLVENAQKIYETHIEKNSKDFVDPLDIDTTIQNLSDDIDNFLNEVDYVLSTSNVITKIDLDF